jgi:hypothetical protein
MRPKQPSLSFINAKTGEPHTEIWDYLSDGYWRNADFSAHETNTLRGIRARAQMVPVLADFIPIEIGQSWNLLEKRINEVEFTPNNFECDLYKFLKKSERFLGKFENKHIGVQLSGGVDSSLIIGLLKHFGLSYSLIGFRTQRYEFKTDVYIQNILANESKNSRLICYDDYLPYSGLIGIPPHQHPNLSSSGLATDQAMASSCIDLGVDILFTGCGGDVALGNEVIFNKCTWVPAIFNDLWLQDIVFTPKGIQVVSFFSDNDILECLWNLRRGQKADPRKLWARNFFRDFLPRELVDFTYKTDFWGLYIDGLVNSLPEIRSIHKIAYELSGNPYFEVANFDAIFKNDLLNCDQKLYQIIEARISASVWINSLLENK